MTKAALRAIYKEKRKILSSPERSRFADLVLINFQKINLPFIKCVHTYLTLDDEIDTEQVIKYLEFRNPGLQVCIPKINTITRQIENFIYSEETEMNINEFGIVEPVNGDPVEAMDIDLI